MAVLATAIWRVRPSGNSLNGGGYDPGIAGAATDYSQQNAAQAIGTNGSTTGAGATTFTDSTAGAFTSAMVGNCIQIASGTNFQAGFYFVTAFTNANSVVLDRTPTSGGAGSAGVWKLGGGWANWWTNAQSTGPLVTGNTVYILGSGTPNPASYVVDYTMTGAANFTFASGSTTGKISFLNDPNTPGYKAPPDTTGGMPTTKFIAITGGSPVAAGDYLRFQGLWFIGNNTLANNFSICDHVNYHTYLGCVVDQLGDYIALTLAFGSVISGCEIFSSVTPASGGGANPIELRTGSVAIGCNIHDTNVGILIQSGSAAVINCIVAKTTGIGIQTNVNDCVIMGCTIDGNGGNGIDISGLTAARMVIYNNIISNHTAGGTFGLNIGSGTAAQNNKSQNFIDYNTYYNNTTDTNNIGYGVHDTHGGSNPYVGQSTENYTLA